MTIQGEVFFFPIDADDITSVTPKVVSYRVDDVLSLADSVGVLINDGLNYSEVTDGDEDGGG